jgi:exosortase/archaeosortase family protein
MVVPLLLVCWMFAFITPLRGWVRWSIILLSPAMALVCNVIRLIPTVLMYGYADRGLAGKFHDYAGWPMILVAFLILMLGVKLVESCGFEVRQPGQSSETPAAGGVAVAA